jgi:hypothetical protein
MDKPNVSFVYITRPTLATYLQLKHGKRGTRRRVTKLFLALAGFLYAMCRRHGACDWSVARLRAQAMRLTGEPYSLRQAHTMLKLLRALSIVEQRPVKEGHLQWRMDLPKANGLRISLKLLLHPMLTGEAVVLFAHMQTLSPLNRAKLRSKKGAEDWTNAGLARALFMGLDAVKEALSLLQAENFISATEAGNQFRLITINPEWEALCGERLDIMNQRRREKMELERQARQADFDARFKTPPTPATDIDNASNIRLQRQHHTSITPATRREPTPSVGTIPPLSILREGREKKHPSLPKEKQKPNHNISAIDQSALEHVARFKRSLLNLNGLPGDACERLQNNNGEAEWITATEWALAEHAALRPRLTQGCARVTDFFSKCLFAYLAEQNLARFNLGWLCTVKGRKSMAGFRAWMAERGMLASAPPKAPRRLTMGEAMARGLIPAPSE